MLRVYSEVENMLSRDNLKLLTYWILCIEYGNNFIFNVAEHGS